MGAVWEQTEGRQRQKRGDQFRVITIIQARNDGSLKAVQVRRSGHVFIIFWRQSWQDLLRTTDGSGITPKFCGLCTWKGKLTFAEKQKTGSRAIWLSGGAVSGAQCGHVRFEVLVRHPAEAVKKTDKGVWSSEGRTSWRYKFESHQCIEDIWGHETGWDHWRSELLGHSNIYSILSLHNLSPISQSLLPLKLALRQAQYKPMFTFPWR